MLGERRRRVGFLAGDFPWSAPPRPIGKLISAGVMARNMTRALGMVAEVLPFAPVAGPEDSERAALADLLRRVDVLWADAYPGRSERALQVRGDLGLPCRAVICAQGVMPKAAEAMLLPWRDLLRPGDALLFTCAADRAIWRRLVRHSALDEFVVPLPVDDGLFHPQGPEAGAAARAEWGIPPDAPLLLYVGRLNIQKNLHSLILLLAAVRRVVHDARLCLVGAEDDIVLGEFGVTNAGYVRLVRDLAAQHGVEDAVHWAGPLYGEELARAYFAADVLVNLGFYHRENFGLSQAEAQACGRPVVCSDWGGFKDVVVHGRTGYRVETVITRHGVRVDVESAAATVVGLLRDHDLRRRIGRQAAEYADAHFSIGAVAAQLADVVNDIGTPSPTERTPDAAYILDDFALHYEAHKRECGWYDPQRNLRASYPPMFQGADYALYQTLMAPYATRVAADLPSGEPAPYRIPARRQALEFDMPGRVVLDPDPVWPHRSTLSEAEWETLQSVDGARDIAGITRSLAASGAGMRSEAAVRSLYEEGLVSLPMGLPSGT